MAATLAVLLGVVLAYGLFGDWRHWQRKRREIEQDGADDVDFIDPRDLDISYLENRGGRPD
jgi:hypothetical protein